MNNKEYSFISKSKNLSFLYFQYQDDDIFFFKIFIMGYDCEGEGWLPFRKIFTLITNGGEIFTH